MTLFLINYPIKSCYEQKKRCILSSKYVINKERSSSAGGAGGRSPLAGVRGVPASSLHPRRGRLEEAT